MQEEIIVPFMDRDNPLKVKHLKKALEGVNDEGLVYISQHTGIKLQEFPQGAIWDSFSTNIHGASSMSTGEDEVFFIEVDPEVYAEELEKHKKRRDVSEENVTRIEVGVASNDYLKNPTVMIEVSNFRPPKHEYRLTPDITQPFSFKVIKEDRLANGKTILVVKYMDNHTDKQPPLDILSKGTAFWYLSGTRSDTDWTTPPEEISK